MLQNSIFVSQHANPSLRFQTQQKCKIDNLSPLPITFLNIILYDILSNEMFHLTIKLRGQDIWPPKKKKNNNNRAGYNSSYQIIPET